jgi:hypothetical protein
MLSLDVEKETGKPFDKSRLHSESESDEQQQHRMSRSDTAVVYSFSKEQVSRVIYF